MIRQAGVATAKYPDNGARPMSMLRLLYELAVAQQEGWGTVYEYWVKYLYLKQMLDQGPDVKRVVIAGLPERYGHSLDFLWLAQWYGAHCTVIDEDPAKIETIRHIYRQPICRTIFPGGRVEFMVRALADGQQELVSPAEAYDVLLSCEFLQRVPAARRPPVLRNFMAAAARCFIFVPNAAHQGHQVAGGLAGISAAEIVRWRDEISALRTVQMRFLDCPFWTAGNKTQRFTRLIRGDWGIRHEILARVVRSWALVEQCCPNAILGQFSHLICIASPAVPKARA